MIFVFDLEGPLSPMDHAAEAMRIIGKKLGQNDFFDFFGMFSLYDDELTFEQKPGYNPGDTLRLIAPIIATRLSDNDLREISEQATLTPGAQDLIDTLELDDVYVASTSYQQHAYTIARKLGLKEENVNCTELPKYSEFPYYDRLFEIFEKFKSSDISVVKKDLDALFWGEMNYDYLKTKVCGGQRKLDVVERLSFDRGRPVSEFVVVGDSITDINMLKGVRQQGGLAISFNGNEYSAPKANLAVSANSLMAIRPILDNIDDPWTFVDSWNYSQDKYKLLEGETKEYFEENQVKAYYDKIKPSTSDSMMDEIIKTQKEMRKKIRAEYGDLS